MELVDEFRLKNKATSNIPIKGVLNYLGLNTKNHMADSSFSTKDVTVYLQLTKGTQ